MMNHKMMKCLVCLSVACYCVGGPVFAGNDKAKDLGKGVAYVVATSTSVVADFRYFPNTISPGQFSTAPAVDFEHEYPNAPDKKVTPEKK